MRTPQTNRINLTGESISLASLAVHFGSLLLSPSFPLLISMILGTFRAAVVCCDHVLRHLHRSTDTLTDFFMYFSVGISVSCGLILMRWFHPLLPNY